MHAPQVYLFKCVLAIWSFQDICNATTHGGASAVGLIIYNMAKYTARLKHKIKTFFLACVLMGNYERGWEMKEQFFFFFYTASSSGERRSVMSLAAGQELLLRIDTDNNTQCMNYIIALAFVITSLLSVLSFHLWISTLSALQQCLSGRKKKKKRNDSALPLNQVWKWFSFSSQDFGILMGLCSRSGLLMLFTESTRCSYLARSSRRQTLMRSWPLQLQDQPAWGTDRGAPRN